MRTNLIKLLGGLLAVAALAVIPAGATGSTSAAKAGDSGGCNDHVPPYSRWGNGWWGNDGDGRYWRGWDDGNGYFGGRAWDPNCDATHKGRVAHVMVAVEHKRGDNCRRLSARHRLGKAGDCGRHRWLRARGTSRWRHNISRPLPAGHYVLHRRAIDAAGNKERPHTRHVWIR